TPVGIVRISDKAFQLVEKDPAAHVAYTLYGTEDGMAGLPTAPGSQAAVRAADGRIWFVTTNGITIVDPRMITDDSTIPPVHIEGLVADARRLGAGSHPRLAPKTSTIEIDYSAVTFSSPKKVRYRYRLDVEEDIRETRQSIWNLRSPKLDRSDLAAALRQTGERATSGTPVQFSLTTTGQAHRFETDVEQQLLRIGEQAVLNSVRHA